MSVTQAGQTFRPGGLRRAGRGAMNRAFIECLLPTPPPPPRLPATGSPTSPICCSASPRCAGPATPSSAGSPPDILRRYAVVPALVAGVSHHSAVRLEASGARLGRDPRPPRHHGGALRHRHRRLQHHAILGARAYPGAEHAAAAVGRAAVRRGMVAVAARHPADAGAGRRARAVAGRRAGHPAARRPDDAEEYRVQPRRPDLHRGAGDLRALLGAVAEAAEDPRPVLRRLHLRLRRGRA